MSSSRFTPIPDNSRDRHQSRHLVKAVKRSLQAFCQFMVHHPDYQPAKPSCYSKYAAAARVAPFCSPTVEQKMWLEEQYQAPSYPHELG